MIKLYDFDLSGNCYKVRLLLGILGLEFERKNVDFFPGFKHRAAEFLAVNPLGQLPVLEDGDLSLRDSHAILVYLASKYDGSGRWYPTGDAALLGEIQQWLSLAEGLTATASAARLAEGMDFDFDAEAARKGAYRLFDVLDEHLWFREREGSDWICAPAHPTIADLACFPYVMLSEEGGVSREDYPAIRRWTDRVKRIPGFSVMPGIFPAQLGS
ncbi:glutathione S-transferase [Pseudooceanicola antarcticus]|uniref:Glutathione S-transferase n=1 Tax=Pseudooceanicola antarcticus TaxID=1247613 RepID=A0A285JF29_9RHOB|nr:glutathione S-transferase family protein [Pseudooceanicola antarcticus]PJE31073.1 glutathione S-transferase family protein [Pseudooceanicola antarcticus]SNY58683.1 glutathione S-transferase [Pseudooceanicola antarcticus]